VPSAGRTPLNRLDLSDVLLPAEEAASLEVRGDSAAAVLVPLVQRNGRLHTILTERRHDLRQHAGEIAFPGGRRDGADAGLLHTALRESQEEIGLAPEKVRVLGALQPISMLSTGYGVYPFVGAIPTRQRLQPSEHEVASLIDVAVDELQSGHQRRRLMRGDTVIWTDAYVVGQHVVWGATARIVADLIERLQLAGILRSRIR
jgi:8-oxo-dGTP pyrophosphatase MutT (NUDIX family)